jgi:hypothetical protein
VNSAESCWKDQARWPKSFGFQQIFWYPTTLTDLHAQRPPTFGINHNGCKRQFMVYSTLETESSIALPTDCRRIAGEPECMVRRIGHEAPAWDPRSAGQLSSRTAAVCGQLRTTDGGNVSFHLAHRGRGSESGRHEHDSLSIRSSHDDTE